MAGSTEAWPTQHLQGEELLNVTNVDMSDFPSIIING